MSGQRASCCGGVDETPDLGATTERATPTTDARIEGHATVAADRPRVGLIQTVRRLFGAANRTEKA